MKKRQVLGLLIATGLASQVLAAPSAEQWQAFAAERLKDHVVPGYQALETAATALDTQAKSFCVKPDVAGLAATKQAFAQALQAWQGIQHIQYGPVTLLMRNYSLQYWPDKKNLGGRQLNSLLSKEQQLDDAFWQSASVAVKGFPALEKLLYRDNSLQQAEQQPRYCQMIQGISHYIATTSASIVNEWSAEAENFASFGEEHNFDSAADAATVLLKALVEPIEGIRDSKINRPIGKALENSRWRRSESWRSGQSVANIRSNIAALQSLYKGGEYSVYALLAAEQPALADAISSGFAQSLSQAEAISEPGEQLTAEQFAQLQALEATLQKLGKQLLQAMQLLDIQLGFNSRDGD